MRRKVFLALLPSLFRSAPLPSPKRQRLPGAPDPTTCSRLSGAIHLGDPVTTDGNEIVTQKKGGAGTTTVDVGTFTCSAGAGSAPTLTVNSNTKNTQVTQKPTKTYVVETWSEFTGSSNALKKSLKSITFTINGTPNTWKTKGGGLTFTGCPGEIGYSLNGQVKGTYDTKTASILVCLGATTRADNSTGSFITDYNNYDGNPAGNGSWVRHRGSRLDQLRSRQQLGNAVAHDSSG